MATKKSINANARTVFHSVGGDDTENGGSPETALAGFQFSIDTANAKSPTLLDPVTVESTGGGKLTNDAITVPGNINIDAPRLVLEENAGNVLLTPSGTQCIRLGRLNQFSAASTDTIVINNAVQEDITVGTIQSTSPSCSVLNITGVISGLFTNIVQLDITGAGSIGTEWTATGGTGNNVINHEDVRLAANNLTGFSCNSTSTEVIVAKYGSMTASTVTGVTGFDIIQGLASVRIAELAMGSGNEAINVGASGDFKILCGIATGDITVDVGGVLDCLILSHPTGTITNNGTINGWIDGVAFGTAIQDTIYTADGTITDTTRIITSGASSVLVFDGGAGGQTTMQVRDGAVSSGSVNLLEDSAQLDAIRDTEGNVQVKVNPGAGLFLLTDNRTVATGIEYAADYSANFTTRSLTDKAYTDSNSIYLSDGVIDGVERNVLGNNAAALVIAFNDLATGTFNTRARSIHSSAQAFLAFEQGDGAGAVTSQQFIDFTSASMLVQDTTNTKGLEYAADYSADFIARSLIDMAYSDAGSLYRSDGTLTGARVVKGEGGNSLTLNSYDLLSSTYTKRGELLVDDLTARLALALGTAGVDDSIKSIDITAASMLITDTSNLRGLAYNNNYSVFGVSTHGDRWIPDRGFVDLAAVSNTLVVRSLSDLPAPVSTVITIPASVNTLIIKTDSLDLGVNKILSEVVLSITGISALATTITSSHADATIDSTGFFLAATDITIANTGTNTRSIRHTRAASIFFIGASVISDDIELGLFSSSTIEDSQFEGFVNFVSANPTSRATFLTANIVAGSAFSSIIFDEDATLGSLDIDNAMYSGTAGGHLIEVENPDDIGFATLENSQLGALGEILQCTPVSSSNFTPVTSNVRGACVDADGNLITSDITSGNIVRYVGISSTVDTTIAAPSSNVQAVTWFKGDLYSGDFGGAVRRHAGFTTTITTTVTVTENVIGLTFVGDNLVTIDSIADLVTIKEGFSDTNISTFATPGPFPTGIDTDGLNLIISADSTIFVMENTTATEQYSFASPVSGPQAVEIFEGGALVAAQNAIFVFDHTITFDQSSATWDLMDNAGFKISSDRGGSVFDNATVFEAVAATQNVFTDIADGGVDIFYSQFAENEKCILSNEENGEITWTGVRERGRVLVGYANVIRDGATNRVMEMVIVINGVIQEDSKTSVFLNSGTDALGISTLPISRDLSTNDTLKLQVKDLSSSNGLTFVLAKLGIH